MAFGMTFALSAGRDRPVHRAGRRAQRDGRGGLLRDTNLFVAVPAGLVGRARRRPRERPPDDPAAGPVVPHHPGHGRASSAGSPAGSPSSSPVPVRDDDVHRASSGRATSGRCPSLLLWTLGALLVVARRLPQDDLRPGAAGHRRQPDRGALLGHQHDPHPGRRRWSSAHSRPRWPACSTSGDCTAPATRSARRTC